MRVTSGGLSICKFGLAVSRFFTSKDGEQREETTFVDVDAFGRQAETISKYLAKGRPVFVEGRLKLDQWETQQGEKRSKLGVILEGFQFIDSRGENSEGGGNSGGGSPAYDQASPPPRNTQPKSETPAPAAPVDDIDEDVPF